MLKNMELRKLPSDALCNVVNILEVNNDWKKVMSIIPKSLQSGVDYELKYNNEHMRLIEDHAKLTNKKCTEVLMDEWGTSGRVRPTLSTLKDILIKAQIFRAADEIAKMLQESMPVRPACGPAAPVTLNVTEMLNEESAEQRLNNMSTARKTNSHQMYNGPTKQMKSVSNMIEFSKSHSNSMNIPDLSAMLGKIGNGSQKTYTDDTLESINTETSKLSSSQSNSNNTLEHPYQTSFPNIPITMAIDSAILQDTNLIHFNYIELENITGHFSEVLCEEPNALKGRIGSGGFGDVFVGKHSKHGILAVKKAHNHLAFHSRPNIAIQIFNSEVKYLSQFRHTNIVPILGFSKDGPAPCIVCEYIDGGSLLQNIEAKFLNEAQRINIMFGTAEGLKYLHTSEKSLQSKDVTVGDTDSQNSIKNFVHGDVKTANILLTSNNFVPKLCDFGLAKQYDSTFVTTCPMGTSAYMAPEGIHGTITQKIDIYSFGIVLLELLTGLKPIVSKDGENLNIKHYVEENTVNNDIKPLLDPVVETWIKAKEIYNLAKMCLEHNRKSRPAIVEVCDIIDEIKIN